MYRLTRLGLLVTYKIQPPAERLGDIRRIGEYHTDFDCLTQYQRWVAWRTWSEYGWGREWMPVAPVTLEEFHRWMTEPVEGSYWETFGEGGL